MTKTYDEQRRNRLADVVADYLGDEEVAAEKFCTELTQEVREWANYHKDQFNKANKIRYPIIVKNHCNTNANKLHLNSLILTLKP